MDTDAGRGRRLSSGQNRSPRIISFLVFWCSFVGFWEERLSRGKRTRSSLSSRIRLGQEELCPLLLGLVAKKTSTLLILAKPRAKERFVDLTSSILLQHCGKKLIAVALVGLSVFLMGIQARASHRLLVFTRNTLNFRCRCTWGTKYSAPSAARRSRRRKKSICHSNNISQCKFVHFFRHAARAIVPSMLVPDAPQFQRNGMNIRLGPFLHNRTKHRNALLDWTRDSPKAKYRIQNPSNCILRTSVSTNLLISGFKCS
jgi:hypothetical protein